MVAVVIHANPSQAHQVEFGAALWEGFKVHGIEATVTSDRRTTGDIHVVQGPWWCLQSHKHLPWVLHLDRAYYGDPFQNVSLGWLKPDGGREFRNRRKLEPKGEPPLMWPRKDYQGTCIVFGDYARDMREEVKLARAQHERVWFKPHPAEHIIESPCITFDGDLDLCWNFASAAVGHASSVLVDAERHGLAVTSTDPGHVVHHDGDREAWLKRLTWTQWHIDECASGAFWEHLKPCNPETSERRSLSNTVP